MANSEVNGIPQVFGSVLRRTRVAQGLSQEDLAHRAGIDRTFVYRLEHGIRQPTITTIIGISEALGVKADQMVRETEAEYRNVTKQSKRT